MHVHKKKETTHTTTDKIEVSYGEEGLGDYIKSETWKKIEISQKKSNQIESTEVTVTVVDAVTLSPIEVKVSSQNIKNKKKKKNTKNNNKNQKKKKKKINKQIKTGPFAHSRIVEFCWRY